MTEHCDRCHGAGSNSKCGFRHDDPDDAEFCRLLADPQENER